MGKPFAEPNLRVHGLISTNPETIEYRLTSAGEELKTVVFDLGMWGQRWIETRLFEEFSSLPIDDRSADVRHKLR